jgi:ubiquinone/menaquinone biosynthesis C-methylase UbiE
MPPTNQQALGKIGKMGRGDPSVITKNYDLKMSTELTKRFYGGSDFFNFGFWHEGTQTGRAACENLMAELLAMIPNKHGSILDVACGLGATTRYLTRYYSPFRTVAVNISPTQLVTAKKNAPSCSFGVMDATRLAFKDRSFDAVICVEAAFHFKTREEFLAEALRVLRPRGRLVLSDMILSRWAETHSPAFFLENHIDSAEDYRKILKRVGFSNVVLREALEQTWIPYVFQLVRYLRGKVASGELSLPLFNQFMFQLNHFRVPAVKGYLLVGAERP